VYKKGDLKITDPPCEEWMGDEWGCDYWGNDGHTHSVRDSRESSEQIKGVAYLPHSCDEWVIGGKEEIKALMWDLRLALIEFEQREFREALKQKQKK